MWRDDVQPSLPGLTRESIANSERAQRSNFPEFHNVYIESGSYETYKKTG
jgi:hypothetical protein